MKKLIAFVFLFAFPLVAGNNIFVQTTADLVRQIRASTNKLHTNTRVDLATTVTQQNTQVSNFVIEYGVGLTNTLHTNYNGRIISISNKLVTNYNGRIIALSNRMTTNYNGRITVLGFDSSNNTLNATNILALRLNTNYNGRIIKLGLDISNNIKISTNVLSLRLSTNYNGRIIIMSNRMTGVSNGIIAYDYLQDLKFATNSTMKDRVVYLSNRINSVSNSIIVYDRTQDTILTNQMKTNWMRGWSATNKTELTTTSATFQSNRSLVFIPPVSGYYILSWVSENAINAAAATSVGIRIRINTITISESYYYHGASYNDADKADYPCVSGFSVYYLVGGVSTTMDLYYCVLKAGETGRIRNVVLTARRLR